MIKSTNAAIADFLTNHQHWQLKNNKLNREFKFKNFIEAFGFMSKVALLAEKSNHHPEWSNIYNRVEINLTTHEACGISTKDFELIEKIDKLAC